MLSALIRHGDKVKFLLKDHAPTILTGVGVTGTIATAYLTGRASFKAAELIEKDPGVESMYVDGDGGMARMHRPLTNFEKSKLVWKLYIPPLGAGVLTVGCIITANRISAARIAALGVAAGISERALQEYKDKVLERLGEKQSEKIRDEIAQDRVNDSAEKASNVVVMGSGDVLCYDGLTGRYFTSSVEKIKQAENHLNFEVLRHMYASLSEFYEQIGLPPTTYSDSVGWHSETGEINVMLSTTMTPDNRPCISIDFEKMPQTEYYKLHE
jgi:hypothetical protein